MESALINSINKLWNNIWPEERFKLCIFLAISILYCLTLVVIPILAYFTFILLKFVRTQDLDVLRIMKSRIKRLFVGITMAAVVIMVFKGVVTKIEIDHFHAELETINHELLTLRQEHSILLQEHKEQYQKMAAQRRQSKDIRSLSEAATERVEETTFNYEKAKMRIAMGEKVTSVGFRKRRVESKLNSLYYSLRDWGLYTVIIVFFMTLYYMAFKFLFLKPLLLTDIKRVERE